MLTLDALARLHDSDPDAVRAPLAAFDLKGRKFDFDARRETMGVVNLSADSWYRESVCLSVDHAVARGRSLALQGAALVDVGAESTLPEAALVSADTQQSMLLPVVEQLAQAGVLVSVETYHASVARAALARGAAVINLTGMAEADAILDAVAEHGAGVILCFVAGDTVRQVTELPPLESIIDIQLDYFARAIDRAQAAGVSRIFVDSGLGFYYKNSLDGDRRVAYQSQVFLNSFRFRRLGWPVCHALPHAFHLFREEVRSAEGYFAVLAALGGCSLFRTHEVERVVPVLKALALA